MICTNCNRTIARNERYHRTKKGPHHQKCPLPPLVGGVDNGFDSPLVVKSIPANTDALEAEIIMLRACNDTLVKQEQNARVLCNALRGKLEEKNKALKLVWEWFTTDNPSDIDGDYIKRILEL